MTEGVKAQDAQPSAAIAWLNAISARQGFPDGDPRAGPFDQSQLDDARRFLNAADRRSKRLNADLYAVRLQFGRGVGRRRTAAMFGISDGVIATRMVLPGRRRWICNMSDRDRRELARLVWLAGLIQPADTGKELDEAALKALRTASDWKCVDDDDADIWLPQDENGEHLPMKIHKEISDDDFYTDRDPYRDERLAVLARLEAELDAIEDDEEEDGEEDEEGEAEGGEEAETAVAEGPDPATTLDGVPQSE